MGTRAVKIVVIYPRPQDPDAFEPVYHDETMRMVEAKIRGMTRFVATKVVSSPQGKVTAYRIAEVYFSTMEELTKVMESDGGKEVAEHVTKISTGGPPILLICEEESFVYW